MCSLVGFACAKFRWTLWTTVDLVDAVDYGLACALVLLQVKSLET